MQRITITEFLTFQSFMNDIPLCWFSVSRDTNTRLLLLIENTPVKSTHPLDSIEKRKEQALDTLNDNGRITYILFCLNFTSVCDELCLLSQTLPWMAHNR